MKFVPTVFAARQFVNHGHVNVNGRRVNIPSYRVREGDIIEVREKSRQMVMVLEAIESPERDVPFTTWRRQIGAKEGCHLLDEEYVRD
jgi:small subunit ribosomal protein S4